jgi:hypothetical protein
MLALHTCLLVRLAACFKCVQVAPSPLSEAASTAVGTDPLTGPQIVYVLSSDKDSILHTMKNPGSNFAACSCNTGKQGSVCKHQVAWLLAQYPYGDSAERLIVKMLGTRLGFVGGCSMEDIQDLTVELSSLQLQQPSTAACATRRGPFSEHCDEVLAMHLGQENSVGSSNLLARAGPGQQAMENHRQRMEALLKQQWEALQSADPLRQKDLMTQQESAHRSLLKVMQAAAQRVAQARPVSNFTATGDGHFLRKRSCLDGPRKSKRSAEQQPAGKRPRQDFVNTRVRDDSACISKAFNSGHSAKEAARHVANCLRTSHSTTATLTQQPSVQSEAPPGLPLLQQQQDMQALSLQPFSSSSSPHHQQLQYQQVQRLLAPPVMPQSPLRLLHRYMVNKDRRRMDAAAAAATTLPHSSLVFPEYGGPQPPQ